MVPTTHPNYLVFLSFRKILEDIRKTFIPPRIVILRFTLNRKVLVLQNFVQIQLTAQFYAGLLRRKIHCVQWCLFSVHRVVHRIVALWSAVRNNVLLTEGHGLLLLQPL